MSHCGLAIALKSILRKKKNYGNSNISPCKNIIFKKSFKKETKTLQDIITQELISSFNTSQNIIFQKSSHKNRPITEGPKSPKLLYSITNLNTISLLWFINDWQGFIAILYCKKGTDHLDAI